jgi:hypothetical protein
MLCLRRVVFNVGLECFDVSVGDLPDTVDGQTTVDMEATDDYQKKLKQSRVKKTAEYYNNGDHMMELPILTVLVGIYDFHLLYPMLGDPTNVTNKIGEKGKASKLDKLL